MKLFFITEFSNKGVGKQLFGCAPLSGVYCKAAFKKTFALLAYIFRERREFAAADNRESLFESGSHINPWHFSRQHFNNNATDAPNVSFVVKS